ncbi:MAG: hypothetical protein AAF927_00665 [Bacteroidota bacterium]
MKAQSELESFRYELIEEKRDRNRDKIILGYIIYAIFTFLLMFFLNQVFPDWYGSLVAKIVYGVWSLGWFTIPLLLAYQVKSKRLRKLGVTLATLYLIFKISAEFYGFFEAIRL